MSVGSDWNIFEVFIASPGDLERERDAVERAIQQWNASIGQPMRTILLSRRWEQLSPQSHTEAQDYINRAQVERADILIAFFDKKAGRGTINEIDLFLSSGKSQTSMIYFTANQPYTPEISKLIERFQSSGFIGSFKDARELGQKVRRDLTSPVERLQKYARHSWPRLKSVVADIQNHAPHLLARFLTEELLRKPTEEMEYVRDEARSFVKYAGYNGYKAKVHRYLKVERDRQGTRVYAICREKGLGDDQEALDYFQRFYDFPNPRFKKNQVFRVFVEQGKGRVHRRITRAVIDAHEKAHQVVPLRVNRKKRKLIDHKFPGLCTALDEGFGLVLFVRRDGSKTAIVHQGVHQGVTFAVFDEHTNLVKHLMALTYELYRTANEYHANRSLREEIDSLFN